MGGCISSQGEGSIPVTDSPDANGVIPTVSIGKNQPLKPDKPKWKSDIPLTEGQLRSKRDEFWDTAPAFEGRKEIWDALKAAAHALETNDHALAQAIVDGANISLPNGTLLDCYDELGNRYQLPVYVVSVPANMIQDTSDTDTATDNEAAVPLGYEIPVKFRLSTGADLRMVVRTTDTVIHIKRRIHSEAGVDPNLQRFYYGGRLLSNKMRLEDCKIAKGYVVQVVVTEINQLS